MLYNNKLEKLVFSQHNKLDVDELVIISGYLGPAPVQKLSKLPLNTKVIYGMYASDGISAKLHNALVSIEGKSKNIDITYSTFPVHSKCYIWKKEGKIVYALLGSANFSAKGLNTAYREVLTVSDRSTFKKLDDYIELISSSAILCTSVTKKSTKKSAHTTSTTKRTTDYCRMTLLDPQKDETHNASGLNWGGNKNNHTNPRDSAIPIRTDHIKNYPELFPVKLLSPTKQTGGRSARHNDVIDILWDDNTTMVGLLEGNQPQGATIKYPKQIASAPSKSTMGDYLRKRLGLKPAEYVTKKHLETYGRTHIDVSIIGEGVYYLDFSVPISNT